MSDISATTSATATTSSANAFESTALTGIDKDMFLKLLVAQMQYQNPMQPADSETFLNQAAQYASVEQLENMTKSQAELRSLQMIGVATDMVGSTVTGLNSLTGEPVTGVVTSVQFGGSEPMLMVDGAPVGVLSVSEIADGPGAEVDDRTGTATTATSGSTGTPTPAATPAEPTPAAGGSNSAAAATLTTGSADPDPAGGSA